MKPYIYAGIVLAVLGVGFWLRWDAVNDYEAKIERASAAHVASILKAEREHDETKRRLKDETRKRMDAIAALGAKRDVQSIGVGRDDCYRLDDPLPDDAARILRQSGRR